MKCELCGKEGPSIKRSTRSFGKGANLVVIENIPVVQCASCGESYVTAATARELDRIRVNRRELGRARSVLVASFRRSAA